jgi:hypothetical protein
MIRFLLVSVTGWVAVLAMGIVAALPYVLRNKAPQPSAEGGTARLPALQARMWPHYWMGYALVALVLTHASFVMGPAMGRSDAAGMWAATLALCLLFLQVGLGWILKGGAKGEGNPRQLRRWHFWTMLGCIALTLTHLLRNG